MAAGGEADPGVFPVWTGIEAAGTAILGVPFLGEPAGAAPPVCLALAVAGSLGPKLVTPA